MHTCIHISVCLLVDIFGARPELLIDVTFLLPPGLFSEACRKNPSP